MTLKNNRIPLLCYFKLCALFQSHQIIQTGVTVQKWSIQVKIGHCLSRVTLKFDRWPWQTIGHPFYTTSNLVHHFHEITVEKWSIRVKIAQFLSCVIFKFDKQPWKTIEHLFYATSSFVHHFLAINKVKLELQSGNTQSGWEIFCPMWPSTVWYKTKFGRQNFGYQSWCFFVMYAMPWKICSIWVE